jgi:hypothetical protein
MGGLVRKTADSINSANSGRSNNQKLRDLSAKSPSRAGVPPPWAGSLGCCWAGLVGAVIPRGACWAARPLCCRWPLFLL